VLGEAFGRLASDNRLEQVQELGCGAGEVAALLDEGTDGLGNGVRRGGKIEGQAQLILGAAKGGSGGHGPGEGVGASPGGRVDLAQAAEGGADGSAESREDIGPSLLENGNEAVFGAGGEEREGNGEGAVGEIGGAGPTLGDGKEDGALIGLQ
jgi:hypothetical protein